MNHKKRKYQDEDRANSDSDSERKKQKHRKESKGSREEHYYKRSPYKHDPYRFRGMPEEENPDRYNMYPYRYYPLSPRHESRPRYDYYPVPPPPMGAPIHKKTKRFFLKKKKEYLSDSSDSDSSSSGEDSINSDRYESSSGSSDSEQDRKSTTKEKYTEKEGSSGPTENKSENKESTNKDVQVAGTSKEDRPTTKDKKKKRKRKSKWLDDQMRQLVHSYRQRISLVRGKFLGGSGGKKRRKEAWKDISGEVSDLPGGFRNVQQCKKKIAGLHGAARKKNRELDRKYKKSGAGAIPPEEALTDMEVMIIKYLGEEPTVGIPNVARAPVRPGDEDKLLTPAMKVNRVRHPQEPENVPPNRIKKKLDLSTGTQEKPFEVTSSTNSDEENESTLIPKLPKQHDTYLPDLKEPAFDPSLSDFADSPAKPGIRIAVDDSLNVEYRPYYTPTKPDDVLPKKGLRGVKNPDVHNANPEKPVNTEEVKDLPIVTDTEGVVKVKDLTTAKPESNEEDNLSTQEYNYIEGADALEQTLDDNNNTSKVSSFGQGHDNPKTGNTQEANVGDLSGPVILISTKEFSDLMAKQNAIADQQKDILRQCSESLDYHKENAKKIDTFLHNWKITQEQVSNMPGSIAQTFSELGPRQSDTPSKEPCWYCGIVPSTKPNSYLDYYNKQSAVMYQMYTQGQVMSMQQNVKPNTMMTSDGCSNSPMQGGKTENLCTNVRPSTMSLPSVQANVHSLSDVLQGTTCNDDLKQSQLGPSCSGKGSENVCIDAKVGMANSGDLHSREGESTSDKGQPKVCPESREKNGVQKIPKVKGKGQVVNAGSTSAKNSYDEKKTEIDSQPGTSGQDSTINRHSNETLDNKDKEIVSQTGSLTPASVYGIEATDVSGSTGMEGNNFPDKEMPQTANQDATMLQSIKSQEGQQTGLAPEKKKGRSVKERNTQKKSGQAGTYCTRSQKKPDV